MALSCAVSLWLRLFGRFGPHLWPFWALPCMSPQRISGLSHSGHHHKICQMSECAVQHAIRLRTSQEVVPIPSFSTIAKEPSRLLCGSVQDVYFLKPRDKAETTFQENQKTSMASTSALKMYVDSPHVIRTLSLLLHRAPPARAASRRRVAVDTGQLSSLPSQ